MFFFTDCHICFREFAVLSSLLKEIESKRSELQNVRNVIETENAILRYEIKTLSKIPIFGWVQLYHKSTMTLHLN